MSSPIPIRKRMKRWEIDGGIRFITFSCQHRLPLISCPHVADVFVTALQVSRRKNATELFAWVVMPEHVHMLLRPAPAHQLESTLRSLKMSVAKRAIARWVERSDPVLNQIQDGRGSPRFWQKGGGFDRNVRSESEFCREVRYIHRNPLERGLVQRPEDWRWSSVRWWMGIRENEVVCDPPPGPRESWQTWKGYM